MNIVTAPSPDDFIIVKTTLPARPLPPNTQRQTIETERLVLRPLRQSDIAAFHSLRSQPEVMHFTMQGRVDKDVAETQARLEPFLPPNDIENHNFAICLKETGEMIGIGGNHNFVSSFGWPEVGYMIRKEQWGQGLAPEFLRAFLEAWQKLPRVEAEVKVDPRSVNGLPQDGGLIPEQLIAVTELENVRSQKTLHKCGFDLFLTWKAQDTRGQNGELIDLPTFRFFSNKKIS
ncbi:GNAT domain-containing protein [Dactylonectria macrodidyma]|uniref:GNAT domain-containing protein n=1 Tax=Dactylonectria macrodidyma TaxID=307937 RepID=A0A9P9D308_9HYPO|nr:GNAT domain-containing protein [Dactylonectria macrodidyma]